MREVGLYGADRRECARVEIPSVPPSFELVCWKGRHFLWHGDEGKYIECSVFFASGQVVVPSFLDLEESPR